MRLLKTVCLIFIASLLLTSCQNKEKKEVKKESEVQKKEIISKGQSSVIDEDSDPNALQVAKSLDDFKTLVVAIKAAGVEDALVNAGPLTVFAPVNSAFDKLPEGTVATLLKPENKTNLGFILKNHVAPANYHLKQLKKEAKKGRKLYMASGKYLVVENKEGKIFVGGTEILKTVKVSNGWVHVIGDVLVPSDK
ncbi:fasciclin domain-containing protein [Polaribacter sp. SA4-12]|uniref:fasciclin domain-containing protein n=1 Tax=Polaribacter sp. SA4-12 TaxID=1312072 RepID=UPI000B3D09FD|nr:fasciclin domain-containing protein [Polaribacter sp. SA4-12]ARV14335.1 hypothetical protein BTO07_03825 [Polaribacter sp. SA4-12]